jgi:hypothetical protein
MLDLQGWPGNYGPFGIKDASGGGAGGGRNMVGLVTYMLARYPGTFPAMLDDALSTFSPRAD